MTCLTSIADFLPKSKRLGHFQRLGHFLWEGMKPSPALDALLAEASQGMQGLAILAAWREKNIPRLMRISQRRRGRKGSAGVYRSLRSWRLSEKDSRK